jgi:hypothetical protein
VIKLIGGPLHDSVMTINPETITSLSFDGRFIRCHNMRLDERVTYERSYQSDEGIRVFFYMHRGTIRDDN